MVAFGEFVDGYDLLVMGAALLSLKPALHLSTFQVSWLSAAAFIGAAFGAAVFGDLSDRFGRRLIFVVNLLLFVGAALLAAFAPNVTILFLARVLIGIGVGMDVPTSTSFLAEISPPKTRGRFTGILPNLNWLGGAIVSVAIALAIKDSAGPDTWRWLFGLSAVPALAILLARQSLPESPAWLRAKGREQEALEVYARLGLDPAGAAPKRARRYRELFTGRQGARTGAIALFMACSGFGGAITTVAGPLVLTSTGFGASRSLQFSLLGFVTGVAGLLVGLSLVDRYSRRAYGIVSSLLTLAFGLGMATAGSNHAVLVTCYLLFTAANWAGPVALAWVWQTELFPTRLRGAGVGVVQFGCRLAIAANVAFVPYLLERMQLHAMFVFASAYLLATVLVVAAPFLTAGAPASAEADGVRDGQFLADPVKG
ncbi:MFS transporter [Kitasatospora sp. NA04385]|nr:MFS transporter [Kitasatospora sp. NA04385]